MLKFIDLNDNICSIQESSLAGQDAIWLGIDNNRMHLNKKQVKQLVLKMQKFLETGRLKGGQSKTAPKRVRR